MQIHIQSQNYKLRKNFQLNFKFIFVQIAILVTLTTACFSVFADSLWRSREMLLSGKYDQLEEQFLAADEGLLSGNKNAEKFYDLVYASLLKPSDLTYDSPIRLELEKWLEARPESFAPHTALSYFHNLFGNDLRGTKWIAETSREQVTNMRREHAVSRKYAMQAIKRNNTSIMAYERILLMTRGTSKIAHKPKGGFFKKMLCGNLYNSLSEGIDCEFATETFMDMPEFSHADERVFSVRKLWDAYLFKNMPRWGGSYIRMQAIVEAASPYLNEPDLYLLNQREVTDRMDRFQKEGKFYESLMMGRNYLILGHEKGLSEAEHLTRIYEEMLQAAKFHRDMPNCLYFGDLLTKRYPWGTNYWADYGYCALLAKRWDIAHTAFRYHAGTRYAVDAWALSFLGQSYLHLDYFQEAYTLLKRAERADNSFKKYTQKRIESIEKNHPDKAYESDKPIEEFIKSLPIDYRDFEIVKEN